jgi:hypothetical protein
MSGPGESRDPGNYRRFDLPPLTYKPFMGSRPGAQPSANCRDEHFRRSGQRSYAPTLAIPFDSEAARLRRRRFPG